MKYYTIVIKECNVGTVEVEAENEEQAKEFAYEEYSNGDIYWYSNEVDMEIDD